MKTTKPQKRLSANMAYVNECSILKQLSNGYGPISPEKTLLKCSRFNEKPAEITNSCEVPEYPAVKLSSTIFRQIFPAVLPGKGHSGSMTLLRVVLYRENVPFSQPRD